MSGQYYFYRDEGVLKKLKIEEIEFMEANKNYVSFFAHGYTYKLRTNLEKALQLLPTGQFLQVYRTYVVSVKHTHAIYKDYLNVLHFC